MSQKIYFNNQIQAEKDYKNIKIGNQKRQDTIEYNGRLYVYYGKSNVQYSFCHKAIRIFNFICESLIIPFTLGLMLLSKTYRKCLSNDFEKIKNKEGKNFHIYILKQPLVKEPIPSPIDNPVENIVVALSKDKKKATNENLKVAVEIDPVQVDLPIKADAAKPQVNHKEQEIEQLCEKIRRQVGQNVPITELPKLFNDLESQDPYAVDFAQKVFDSLLEKNVELHRITLSSFPLWPVDVAAIQKIAMEQSSSNHPLLRKRALNACSYLVTCGHKEGLEVAALLAKKNLKDPDEKIQHEGFEYFKLLLEKSKPNLSEEDLNLAIEIASQMYFSGTELWLTASPFFKNLIKHGQEKDILKIKPFMIKAATYEKLHFIWEWADEIVTNHHKCKELIAIANEAAENGILSESPFIRGEVFKLLWRLLSWAPEQSLETALKCILLESKQNNPDIGLTSRIRELLGQECESHSAHFINFVGKNWQNYAPSIMKALNNLSNSNSPYAKQQAEEIYALWKRI